MAPRHSVNGGFVEGDPGGGEDAVLTRLAAA